MMSEPPDRLEKRLLDAGMFAGPRFDRLGLEPDNAMIFCATEARTKDEIDQLARTVGGA